MKKNKKTLIFKFMRSRFLIEKLSFNQTIWDSVDQISGGNIFKKQGKTSQKTIAIIVLNLKQNLKKIDLSVKKFCFVPLSSGRPYQILILF